MRKLAAVLMAETLAAPTLIGCGSSTAPNIQADTTAAPTDKENTKVQGAQSGAQGAQSEAGSSETPITDNSEKTIYMIVRVLGNRHWNIPQVGVGRTGKDLGCKAVVVEIVLGSDIEDQLTFLQNTVSVRVARIVIVPLDSVSLDAPIAETYNSGAPVVLADAVTKSDNYSAALLTSNIEAGKTTAEETIRRLEAKGLSENETTQITVQVGFTGSRITNDKVKGSNEYWRINVPEKWVVLNGDIKVNEGDINKAVGFCQDFIVTYPNLEGAFGPNNGSTVGFVTGLAESKHMDITMVGFDFSVEIETTIRSNEHDAASVVQRQYFMGYDGTKTAVELANGQTIEDKTIDTGIAPMDSKNADSDEIQGIIHP